MGRSRECDAINSNAIVAEVQKRPCLYDSNHERYGDRIEKARCWEDICRVVVPGWTILNLQDKAHTGKDIQKRWRSIRDSYTKSFRQGKCTLPESCSPSSRRYNHHMQMMFLYTALQNKKPKSSRGKTMKPNKIPNLLPIKKEPHIAASVDCAKPLNLKIKPEPAIEQTTPKKQNECEPELQPNRTEIQSTPQSIAKQKRRSNKTVKEDNLDKNCLQVNSPSLEIKIDANSILPEDHFDDDRLFMSSLVPLFKKMGDDTRLMCRIQMLKVVRYGLSLSGQGNVVPKVEVTEAASPKETTLGMVTRSADGSLPARKRRFQVRSPSPDQPPPKRRGPGRPRKTRLPSSMEEEDKDRSQRKSDNEIPFVMEPSMSDLDEKISRVTSVAQLETPLFMKVYNLERVKTQNITSAHVPVKSEPVESVERTTA